MTNQSSKVDALFASYDVDSIRLAYLTYARNKQEMCKHSLGYALSMINYKRYMPQSIYAGTYLRDELMRYLTNEIINNEAAIKRVVSSDYVADQVLKRLNPNKH
jgi:hypothetical protein